MSPENAVAFLLGMYAVTTQTDAIPAVLIGPDGPILLSQYPFEEALLDA